MIDRLTRDGWLWLMGGMAFMGTWTFIGYLWLGPWVVFGSGMLGAAFGGAYSFYYGRDLARAIRNRQMSRDASMGWD